MGGNYYKKFCDSPIVDNNEITGIIDWEEACYGSRYIDVSLFISYIGWDLEKEKQQQYIDAFFDGYEDNIDLVRCKIWYNFLRASGKL